MGEEEVRDELTLSRMWRAFADGIWDGFTNGWKHG